MSNQGTLQRMVRDETGSQHPYNGDWHAFATLLSAPDREWNERNLAVLNSLLGASYTNIQQAKAAFAAYVGVGTWNEVTRLSPDDYRDTGLLYGDQQIRHGSDLSVLYGV